MNEDIIILDDFLPPYIQNSLEKLCESVDFTYNPESNYESENKPKFKNEGDFVNGEMFCCTFWDTRNRDEVFNKPIINYEKIQQYTHYFLTPLQIASLQLGKWFDLENNLFRAKINLQTRGNQPTPLPQYPHLDFGYSFPNEFLKNNTWAVIYYVNDSDGDTIVYNEEENLLDLSKYTIKQKISPKKGRMVFLRGNLYHSASTPSLNSSKRIVINYDLMY
jgi:hypothetical protein